MRYRQKRKPNTYRDDGEDCDAVRDANAEMGYAPDDSRGYYQAVRRGWIRKEEKPKS